MIALWARGPEVGNLKRVNKHSNSGATKQGLRLLDKQNHQMANNRQQWHRMIGGLRDDFSVPHTGFVRHKTIYGFNRGNIPRWPSCTIHQIIFDKTHYFLGRLVMHVYDPDGLFISRRKVILPWRPSYLMSFWLNAAIRSNAALAIPNDWYAHFSFASSRHSRVNSRYVPTSDSRYRRHWRSKA